LTGETTKPATDSKQDTMDSRREIDGLRAIAVLPVIFFHAGFETFSGGFVGVDVFFVISGYLITTIILTELEHGRFSIVNFYERRARRILPALFLVMLVCIPFAWFWLLPSDMKDFSQSLVAVSLFGSNILFWHESGYFDAAAELKPLLHTWSLAVEGQYYVLFPLFLMLFWQLGKRRILVTLGLLFVASLALAQWGAYAKPVEAFYLLPARGWELLVGTFAAFYLSKANRKEFSRAASDVGGWLGVVLILYAIFGYSKATPFPGLYALIPTLGTVLVILFATQQTTVGKFVGNKAFVGIGLLSYSAYLWHQPLFAFARHKSLTEPSYTVFLALSGLALVLSYFSWRYVEVPFRSKLTFNRSQVFTSAFIISVVFISFGYYGHKNNGFYSRIDSSFTRNAPTMALFEDQVRECWQLIENSPKVSSSCVLGEENSPLIFGLIGDSHAGSLLHVLNDEAVKIGLKGKNFSYRSCPPLRRAKPVIQEGGDVVCDELRKDFFKILESNPAAIPDVLVVNARWSMLMEKERFNNGEGAIEAGIPWVWNLPPSGVSYSEAMGAEIVDSIQTILDSGKKVILLYPVPEMGWDVPRVISRSLLVNGSVSKEVGSVSYNVFRQRNKSAIKALDSIVSRANLIRIRPEEVLCNTLVKDRCVAHINGEALYFDNNHLSNKGAEVVLREVISSLANYRP
jgi:peptidoglycan/LPS O-acetylase OafA/YrhL